AMRGRLLTRSCRATTSLRLCPPYVPSKQRVSFEPSPALIAGMESTMKISRRDARLIRPALLILCASLAMSAQAAPLEPAQSLATKEKAPLLATLKELVSIESGSGDRAGLDRLAALIADRLSALGGQVEMIEPNPSDIYRMVDTPKEIGKMVHAR